MHKRDVFEYAILRVVPRPERGECINVGVVLYCKDQRFLQVATQPDEGKLKAICPSLDLEEVYSHLQAFEKICAGLADGGPIAALDLPSRFRWLTARRSTIVQASEVHPGLTANASATLQRLFEELVK